MPAVILIIITMRRVLSINSIVVSVLSASVVVVTPVKTIDVCLVRVRAIVPATVVFVISDVLVTTLVGLLVLPARCVLVSRLVMVTHVRVVARVLAAMAAITPVRLVLVVVVNWIVDG
jgi:hypothetical protein